MFVSILAKFSLLFTGKRGDHGCSGNWVLFLFLRLNRTSSMRYIAIAPQKKAPSQMSSLMNFSSSPYLVSLARCSKSLMISRPYSTYRTVKTRNIDFLRTTEAEPDIIYFLVYLFFVSESLSLFLERIIKVLPQ